MEAAGVAQHYTDFVVPLRLELNPETKARPGISQAVTRLRASKEPSMSLATMQLMDEDAVAAAEAAEHEKKSAAHRSRVQARKLASSAVAEPEPPQAAEQTRAESNSCCRAAPGPKLHSWRFKWAICQFLDESPKTFKDLYVLIAQRHPKHCSITAGANGLVSLANMRWLHELGRDLQKVAINRDGVWHLKEGLDLALLGRFRGFLWLGSGLVLRRWETQIDWVV